MQKPAVLMMAGLECDMNFWLANDPDVTPAFVLANAGYDVWLANNRGTRYGTAHVSLDVKSEEFWSFNQEQLGLYDLPANIDFVLKQTGQQKLTYVGHS
jgi:pimeloyl-ACP methyl ester carboxylesterase